MDFALTELVFVRKAGKVKVAPSLTKRRANVCPIVPEMAILIWRHSNANVMKVGLAKIVRQSCAILIVVPMDGKITYLISNSRPGFARPRPKNYEYSRSIYVPSNFTRPCLKFGPKYYKHIFTSRKGPDATRASEASRPAGRYNVKPNYSLALLDNLIQRLLMNHNVP